MTHEQIALSLLNRNIPLESSIFINCLDREKESTFKTKLIELGFKNFVNAQANCADIYPTVDGIISSREEEIKQKIRRIQIQL